MGYIYKVIYGICFEFCVVICDVDLYCYSFNYVICDKICELSNFLCLVDLEYFVCRFGVVYMDKLIEFVEYCKIFLCRNNGIC